MKRSEPQVDEDGYTLAEVVPDLGGLLGTLSEDHADALEYMSGRQSQAENNRRAGVYIIDECTPFTAADYFRMVERTSEVRTWRYTGT